MTGKENARRVALALALIFISTVTVLTARQLNLVPARPAPEFRAVGPANAPIEIVEYTDLACPACGYAAGIVENLLKVYDGKLRLTFRHYPLVRIHPWSRRAAELSDCAGQQARFREYSALLFESQQAWAQAKEEPKEFELSAQKLKLDWPAMKACAETQAVQRAVTLDMAEGRIRGVNATPTFFINGKRVVGGGQLLDHARNFDNLLRSAPRPAP